MSFQIYLQAEHHCEKCGETTWFGSIHLGSGGMGGMSTRDAVKVAIDKEGFDEDTCSACLGLPDDQPKVTAAYQKRCVEYEPADEVQYFPDYDAPELQLIGD